MVPAVSDRIPRAPSYSGYRSQLQILPVRGFHPLRLTFPDDSSSFCSHLIAVLLPRYRLNGIGLGYSPFARHYLGNHFCFLLLRVLRCFSSPRSPPFRDNRPSTCWVAPFGYLRIYGYLHLPRAFRSLSRPSSPERATGIRHAPFLSFLFFFSRYSRLFLQVTAALASAARKPSIFLFSLYFLCQYVKDLYPSRDSWRITDSNR